MLFHLQNSAAGHWTKFVLVLFTTSVSYLCNFSPPPFFSASSFTNRSCRCSYCTHIYCCTAVIYICFKLIYLPCPWVYIFPHLQATPLSPHHSSPRSPRSPRHSIGEQGTPSSPPSSSHHGGHHHQSRARARSPRPGQRPRAHPRAENLKYHREGGGGGAGGGGTAQTNPFLWRQGGGGGGCGPSSGRGNGGDAVSAVLSTANKFSSRIAFV